MLQNKLDTAVWTENVGHLDTHSETQREIEANVVFRRFRGGWSFSDFGHHQDRYINYLLDAADDEVEEFLFSWSEQGYGGKGETVSYDVTVPVEDRAGNGANPGGVRGD